MTMKQTQVRGGSRDRRSPNGGTVTGMVGVANVDDDLLAKSSLSRIDYVDHFSVTHEIEAHATAEQWARAMFGDAPDLTERLLWSGILGLRLHRSGSAQTIAGWAVTGQGEGWVRMSAASRSIDAELILRTSEGASGLATLVRYNRKGASAVWVPVSFVHRRLAPFLLRSTIRSVGRHLR
jgi:hypothetical protein